MPGIDASSASLIAERDEKRAQDPADPEIEGLNVRISASLAASSRKKWLETVSDADRRTKPTRFWRLLKNLSGKRTSSAPNQPIVFKNKFYTKRTAIANRFVKQYTNIVEYKPCKESRKIIKEIKFNNPLDDSYVPFDETSVIEAIKQSRGSPSAGPDNLTMIHLKHLGPSGIRYLTHLFNLSVRGADLPSIWKNAHVIPVLKPKKPADQGTSYRPISLLCPAVKVLERLLLPSLNASLPPAPHQHGFQRQKSTVTALLPLTHSIAQGFNRPKPATRTGLLCVDLSKAFDIVPHHELLQKIGHSTLHPNLKRWFVTYLRDRKIRVLYQGARSKWKKMKVGVPQGSVISPVIFNFYVNELEAPSASLNGAFADDNHATSQHVKPSVIAENLAVAAAELSDKADELGMVISAEKSSVMLFTPWSKEYGRLPEVKVGDTVIPQETHTKLLGVTFDPTLSFNTHVDDTVKKLNKRVNIVRSLSDTFFGHDTECLTATVKNIFRPLSDYGAPVISTNYSNTSFNKLQRPQNKVLRIVTGTHSAASTDFLSQESHILPAKAHLRLLSCQELAKALQPSHPSHHIVTQPVPRGDRGLKATLRSSCINTVEEFLTDGIVPPGEIKSVLNKIHTKVVSETIDAMEPNRVLGTMPPLVSKQVKYLPRYTCRILAQLRSGFCHKLNDYLLRVGRSDTDICPECGDQQASSSHIFSCAAHPTNLEVSDLWEKPWEVAVHLASFASFSDLPDPGPPPPPPPQPRQRRRPPPEPPPAADPSLSLSTLSPPSTPNSSVLGEFSSLSLNSLDLDESG